MDGSWMGLDLIEDRSYREEFGYYFEGGGGY